MRRDEKGVRERYLRQRKIELAIGNRTRKSEQVIRTPIRKTFPPGARRSDKLSVLIDVAPPGGVIFGTG